MVLPSLGSPVTEPCYWFRVTRASWVLGLGQFRPRVEDLSPRAQDLGDLGLEAGLTHVWTGLGSL